MKKNYLIAVIALLGLSLFSTFAQIKFESEFTEPVTTDITIARAAPDIVNTIAVKPTFFSVFYALAFLARARKCHTYARKF